MDTDASTSTRIAVLIDCDNVSARHAGAVLEELATFGTPTVKRAYGDWTTNQLAGWKTELHRHAIQPVQQFAYTVGKNSTDSALIIDAMDLLWQGNVEAFALVSSDSDFTRLATRLRESGKKVYGLGARKTPESLRRAVDQFVFLEVLQEQATTERLAESAAKSMADGSPDVAGDEESTGINLESALTRAINATSGDDGWSRLDSVGSHLSRAHADFDPRGFGHQRLGTLVAEQPYVETETRGSSMMVRLKQKRSAAKSAARQASPRKAAASKGASKGAGKEASKGAGKAAARKDISERTAAKG